MRLVPCDILDNPMHSASNLRTRFESGTPVGSTGPRSWVRALEHLRYVRYRTERYHGKHDNLMCYGSIRKGTGFSEA